MNQEYAWNSLCFHVSSTTRHSHFYQTSVSIPGASSSGMSSTRTLETPTSQSRISPRRYFNATHVVLRLRLGFGYCITTRIGPAGVGARSLCKWKKEADVCGDILRSFRSFHPSGAYGSSLVSVAEVHHAPPSVDITVSRYVILITGGCFFTTLGRLFTYLSNGSIFLLPNELIPEFFDNSSGPRNKMFTGLCRAQRFDQVVLIGTVIFFSMFSLRYV